MGDQVGRLEIRLPVSGPSLRSGRHYLRDVLAVILSEAKNLSIRRARPFPFAEFTLERNEGLRAAAHALRVTGITSKCVQSQGNPCGCPYMSSTITLYLGSWGRGLSSSKCSSTRARNSSAF